MTRDNDPFSTRPSWRLLVGALALAAAIAGAQLAGIHLTDGGAASPAPSPAPPPSSPARPPVHRLTAAEVVDHRDARLRELVVAPGRKRTRIALWQVCLDRRCQRVRQALAVTDDGFTTRSEISVPGRAAVTVAALGPDAFYLGWSRSSQLVVHGDGSTAPVLHEGGPGPLRDGEVLVGPAHQPGSFLAVAPATGRGHPVSVPPDLHELASQPDGTLLGTAHDPRTSGIRALWSEDRGASWRDRLLPTEENALVEVIPSARPGVLALVEGGDGATLFPFVRVHRSLDGGATWGSLDMGDDPLAYLGQAAVLPDGRLLVDIEAWSDQRRSAPGSRPTGLYVSAGSDWADLSAVDLGAPFDRRRPLTGPLLLTSDTSADGVVSYALDARTGLLFRSRDGGRRWVETAAR